MRFLLDTNIISYWMRGETSIIHKLQHLSPEDIAIASITSAEILYGIAKSPHKKAQRQRKIQLICQEIKTLPFDADAAQQYADIRAHLESQGNIIGERDIQIAAIARSLNLVVVTNNIREFARVPHLECQEWRV